MRGRSYFWALGAFPLACPAAAAPVADPADEPVAAVNDIVVTGERTTRSVKDTASSVTAVSRAEIAQRAAPDRLEQLLEFIPNVQLGSSGEAPSIRGQDGTGVLRDLPGFLGGARPRTTLRVDGRDVGYNEFAFGIAPLWDVERVEVFRSPQTTTQGRNAIAGAIFIETADPGFTYEARARAIVGDARTRQLSAAASGPIVDGQLALRVSGDVRRSRTSSDLGGDLAGLSRAQLNRDEYGVVRAKLLARPHAIPDLRLLLTYAHVASDMPQLEGVRPPFGRRRDPAVTYGYFSTNVDSLTAAITYQIAPRLEARSTLSWGDAAIRRFALAGFGETRIHGRDRSAESLLQWAPADSLEIIGGVHFLTTDLDQTIDLSSALLGTGAFNDLQRSRGLFGQIQWRPVARLTATAGLRHQADSQDRSGVLRRPLGDVPLDYRKTFHAMLPKVSLAYDVSPNVRVGAMVQRAYNPGGVTLNLRTRDDDRFAAERLWNYELFARANLLDGALTVAGNLFYNAIEDAQRSQIRAVESPAGPVFFSEVVNVPAARSYGGEVELGWRPSRQLSLRAAAGLLDTRITRTRVADTGLLGKDFARAPHVSASAGAEWRPLERLRLSAQIRHNSGYFSDDSETRDRFIPGSTTIDAKAGWQAGKLNLFAYARNLADQFSLTYRFAAPNGGARDLAAANNPRELGIGLEAGF